MLFNSAQYLVFFPVVVLFYFLIPHRLRNFWLLLASYYFYMQWNAKYALLLAASTLITYASGLCIEAFLRGGRTACAKGSVFVSFILNIGILVFFKYSNFLIGNINRIGRLLGQTQELHALDILLPVGISFYIFQALSYTMDVYRGKVKATKNLFRYALFVSFFPQLVAGPIERSSNLLGQFDERHSFDADRVRKGLLLMLWGLFLKMVIADNIAPSVNMIYEYYPQYTGIEIIVATVLFAFQIYCDFAGYSLLAIGSAKVLGFRLMENFRAPYLAVSVSDFWDRWHISLTSWFTDYLYIPLGGNRKGTARKYINVFLVFLVSGLWHGAAFTYMAWGVLNGVFMIIEQMSAGLRARIAGFFKADRTRFSYRLGCRILTFVLIDFTWLFFRATGLSMAFTLIRQCACDLQFGKLFGLVFGNIGMTSAQMVVLTLSILLLFAVDTLKERGKDVARLVLSQGIWFRWAVYLGLLFAILIFGVYGNVYEQTQFIYFQF
ncbi:MAG: MBOAT family protein [Lachnospiraceae bacterium]|nr:MBOAT family protein [Lachnospiraceae bacterium]